MNTTEPRQSTVPLDVNTAATLQSNIEQSAGRGYECIDIQRAIESGHLKTINDVLGYAKTRAAACDADMKADKAKLQQFGLLHTITANEAIAVKWWITASVVDLDSSVRRDEIMSDSGAVNKVPTLRSLASRLKDETEY